ncbi:hypothetical protein [Ralstonia phage RPZH3]|nr:hypothetical protein [Ralstonia phage RPZH3]
MSKASMPELLRLFAAKAEEWCNATDTEDAWRIECEAVEAFREAFATAAQEQAEPGADEWAEFETALKQYAEACYRSESCSAMDAARARVCAIFSRAAQSGQRAANLSEATIQALWDEACNDSPQNPGWSRHIRFARAYSRRNPDPRQDRHHNGGDTRPNHPGKASAATPAAQGGEQP